MKYHIITLFPQSLDSYLNESILKRAIEKKKIEAKFYNPRDFATTKKNPTYSDLRVDNKPYGGGPGMIIEALPVIRAIDKAVGKKLKDKKTKSKVKIVWFSPCGKQFDTEQAKIFSNKFTDIVFICGRYEGIDARVKKAFKVEDISVGPFVLTGGELPAMILIDTISRQIEGVLGDHASLEENRIASPDVYTRPEVLEYNSKKYRVPKVLLSGNHKLIDEWRKQQGQK
jgi:tRNA (guanine37-N1)-methyltransferase